MTNHNPIKAMDNIACLEAEMMSWPEEMKSIPPVNHHFAPGCYAREMFIPKGQIIVGKIHKHSHLNVIAFGDICVATFEEVKRYTGYQTMVSSPGIKRVVLALEDTMWITFHPTEETDLKKIEEEVIAKSYDELEFVQQMLKKLETKS